MAGKNTQITVAVISLLGVLGTAIIANWDTIFPPEENELQSTTRPGTQPSVESGGQPEAQTQSIYKK